MIRTDRRPHERALVRYDRLVDQEFERWLRRQLAPRLRSVALRLPHQIGLAQRRRWHGWRGVFATPVMRSLPALVAEGCAPLPRRDVVSLGLAHVLIVFLAFVDDRLNDEQTPFARSSNLVRRALEAEAQARLGEIIGAHPAFWRHYRDAFRAYGTAHADEPLIWSGQRRGYTHRHYAKDSADKIAIGKLAGLAAAMMGGLPTAAVTRLSRALDHCMIALQYTDDIGDCHDDFVAGRWTFFVLCHLDSAEATRRTSVSVAEFRERVALGDATDEFLAHASRHYQRCLRLLDGLRVPTFTAWATAQRDALDARRATRRRALGAHREQFLAALARRWLQ